MKFTLSDCMQRINQILNYPSVAYEDISHFFDHAIAELNTVLRTGIPSVSEMIHDNTVDISLQNNTILLTTRPTNAVSITYVNTVPTEPPSSEQLNYVYYSANTSMLDRKFYVWNGSEWKPYDTLYGILFEGAQKTAYVAAPIGTAAYWVETPVQRTLDFDLYAYMPADWWTLFVIPYVCFKFAVRNGDNGELYTSEYSQGMQQLQTCYDVPNFVTLSDVAGNPVYTKIVKENLDNLSKTIPTRAITESMRIGNAVQAVFGNMFDTGGWGV